MSSVDTRQRPSPGPWTIPNGISLLRIVLIPVFMWLIIHEPTTLQGLILFGVVLATDWVDGTIARRTGQVSEVGKILDPAADRLCMAGGLIALMVQGAVPIWVGGPILARDAVVLLAGAALLLRTRAKIEVRFVGKVATFTLMIAVPFIAWGTLGYAGGATAGIIGWLAFFPGIVEYYIAAGVYLRDARSASETHGPAF
jgi:cardiolipin synthase